VRQRRRSKLPLAPPAGRLVPAELREDLIRDAAGRQRELTLSQAWPVRRPLPERLLRSGLCERRYPTQPLTTTIRLVDTFFPIALGGTACIPGPFGAGKTVLQGLMARYSMADVVIQVACGERAGEVLETISDFATMEDPRGGLLMDRTVVICNTSSMPVAAREASIYMGLTLGEYYRQMGLNVLLIADSTSRWAQAMRETSGRLEEIPGDEGFPAYLDSRIKGAYERAGVLQTNDGSIGSLTMVGTVSPAGGNFDEPVTQSTLGTVKTFLGLSSARAYKRFYPAVDPLISWSRYLDQLRPYFEQHLQPGWTDAVRDLSELLHHGDSIYQMMQVTGEEGITLADYVTYQKSLFLDMVYLQQDAYDKVDVSVPLERQKESFTLLRRLIQRDYPFADKEEAHRFFTQLTGLFKNLNYTAREAPEYSAYLAQIDALVKTKVPLKILDLDTSRRRAVVSQRRALEEDRRTKRAELIRSLAAGQRREGVVVRLVDFGAFVDLGGIDGLIPMSELAFERIEKAADVVAVGERVTVDVLRVDEGGKKISLSRKSALPDPWRDHADVVRTGARVEGKVVGREPRLQVEIAPGVVGSVRDSDANPADYEIGETIEVTVRTVDRRARRILLATTYSAAVAAQPASSSSSGFAPLGVELQRALEAASEAVKPNN